MDNLDSQIHIYDDRKGGFDRTSDCYFGGRYGAPTKSSKGDTHLSLFAKGYEDGTVCVWDYRNGKVSRCLFFRSINLFSSNSDPSSARNIMELGRSFIRLS